MCFGSPNIPPPPALPLPPNPGEANKRANDDEQRRQSGLFAPRSSTIVTSPLGDTNYGKSTMGAVATTGTKIGT